MISSKLEGLEHDLESLRFCLGVFAIHDNNPEAATNLMDAHKSKRQLLHSIERVLAWSSK